MKILKPFLQTSAIVLACSFCSASIAQTPVTVIDNDFVNGNPLTGATGLESPFFTTSSGSGLASDNGTTGVLDFASGGSGRSFHTLFTPQTLVNTGDTLTLAYTFTTPATVGTNEDFRVGLFNTAGAPGFDEDISASSGTPNPILNGLAGISGEFDINTADADFALRAHNVNNIEIGADGVNPDDPATGRLLTTTDGFDLRSSGPNNGFAIEALTEYIGTFSLELGSNGDIITTQTLVGGTVNESFTFDPIAVNDDLVGGDVGVNTLTFDFVGFSVTGGAFGSVGNVGEVDNGADFNSVSVTFTPAAVPEPSSAVLLLVGLAGFCSRRRR